MSKKLRLTEGELHNLIRTIIEQSEPNDYYTISADEYVELMKLSGYHGRGVTKLPKFGGKPLYIKGNVNLSNTDTDSLGNVIYIDGTLSISNTNIKDLGDTKVRGYVSDSNTPREKIRIRIENEKKNAEMESLREDNEWDISDGLANVDDVGIKANALYNFLVSEGELDSDEYDVYSIYPLKYRYHGLTTFQILDGRKDEEYSVGDSDEMDDAALEYAKGYIDDVGVDGFREGFVEDYIDTEYLRDYFEDFMRDDIYSNPEVYFSDRDYELTDEQEKRIEDIEEEIAQYEKEQSDLDSNREDYEELYDDFQDKIDELESEKDEIIPSTEPTDDMVERKLDEFLDDVVRNPKQYIREYGLEMKNFIDENDLAKGLVDTDGWEIMSSYDGSYEVSYLPGKDYYIMRVS
jgi:hypothetical protein